MEQIADDCLGFDLFVDPALAGRSPRRLADVELFGLSLQVSFAGAERAFLSRGPVRERLLFRPDFVALSLEDLPHLIEFAALFDQSVTQAAIMPGELLLSLIKPLLSDFRSAGLSHLSPRFLDRHSPFERRAVCLFQLGSQVVQPFSPAFQVLSVQREHILLAAQVGQLAPSLAFPIFPFANDPLAVVFGELLEGPLRFEEHFSLAIDRAFPFFHQRPDSIKLRLTQPDDRFALFKLPARPLSFAAEFVLCRFDFLSSLRKMLLLKPQPVFKHRSLVTQIDKLLLTLPGEGILRLLKLRFLGLLRRFQCGELCLLLCLQFLTHLRDGRHLDFASMIEFRSFAVAQYGELRAGTVEFVSLADQCFSIGTQFSGEDFFGDILPDPRLGRFDLLQLRLISLFEKLPLPIELHLSALTVHVGRGDRLLQSFPFSGDLRADVREQSKTIGLQLLATLSEIGLFGMKLFDHPLLRGNLLVECRFALP